MSVTGLFMQQSIALRVLGIYMLTLTTDEFNAHARMAMPLMSMKFNITSDDCII